MWREALQVFLAATARLVHSVAAVLPSFLALCLLIAAGWALSRVLRAVLVRVAARAQLDLRLLRSGVLQVAPVDEASPSRLLAGALSWLVFALGFAASLRVVDSAGAAALSDRAVRAVLRGASSVALLLGGFAASRLVARRVLLAAVNMGLRSARAITIAARWSVFGLGAALALEQLGAGRTVLALAFATLFGGAVLAAALALGLGARDLVAEELRRRFARPEDEVEEDGPESRRPGGRLHHL